jgi:predicted nuclease with TOPRIM domain
LMDLEEALARIGELEGRVSALTGERDAASERAAHLESAHATLDSRLAETADARDAVQLALSEANGSLAEAQALGLTHLRRALLAEHAGRVVPELVTGDDETALLASVDLAHQAYERAVESARATIAGQAVPAGAPSARMVAASAGLSPLEMIESGLSRD